MSSAVVAVRAAVAAVLLLAAGVVADQGISLLLDPPEVGRVIGLFGLAIAAVLAAGGLAALLAGRAR